MTTIAQRPVRRFQRCCFVYILASLRGTLYVGLTDDLRKRIMQYKAGVFDGFTRKYKVDRLMYFESLSDSKVAAHRERQIKGNRREKKIALFAESNPQWRDLTPEIFQTIGSRPVRNSTASYSPKFRRELRSYTGDPSDHRDPSLSRAQGRDFRK